VDVRKILAGAVLVLVVVSGLAAYEFYYAPNQQPCKPLGSGGILKSHAASTSFGAVTEFSLPGPNRMPNAVVAAQDGSVWFAEQAIPGVAHLYPSNGTLVEYAWRGYPTPSPPDCPTGVSSSGITVWNGMVWAADEFHNSIVGLNPRDGSTTVLNTTGKAELPYWVGAGPDGLLWFTSDNSPARLGRIAPNLTMKIVSLSGLGAEIPIQLSFANSSLGYLSALNTSADPATHVCICNGHVYSFKPGSGPTIAPTRIGGNLNLALPTSLAYASGNVWVALHGASSVMGLDVASGSWTPYPTSTVSWSSTTLPLTVVANGNKVWYNEHYGNRIALLSPDVGTLTEYSEANPPITGYKGIQNDLSIAFYGGNLWFTSISGNYVGYVDGSRDPGFHAAILGTNHFTSSPGGKLSFTVRVTGRLPAVLNVSVSDSETPQSVPRYIQIVPSTPTIGGGGSSYDLGVVVNVGSAVAPGDYTIAVTIGDGEVQQTVYLFLRA
jgi:streptogramin lyase